MHQVKIKYVIAVAISIGTILPLSGCASIFGSSSDQITIQSNEPGAKIQVNGNEVGQGSAVYSLPRGNSAIVTASKKGCEPRSVPTGQSIDGVTWLDIFFFPAFLVDAATGKMHEADPTHYTVSPACKD